MDKYTFVLINHKTGSELHIEGCRDIQKKIFTSETTGFVNIHDCPKDINKILRWIERKHGITNVKVLSCCK